MKLSTKQINKKTMKEYFRIIFTDIDVMNNEDWEKWNTYSTATVQIGILIVFILAIIVLII